MDVGANFGLFGRRRPEGRAHWEILAIEPLPELVERLRFNLDLNGFSNYAVVAAAVGDRTGEAQLFLNQRSFSEASMRISAGRKGTTVPVMTLQTIVEQAGLARTDFLKVDIEGFEDKAIVPYIRSTRHQLWPKQIYMEILHARHWDTDCLTVLKEHG